MLIFTWPLDTAENTSAKPTDPAMLCPRKVDGVDGTYDDTPARGPQDIARLQGVPVMPNQGTPLAVFSTVSSTFEVRVTARLGALSRRYIAVLRRTSLRDMPVLTFRRE